MAEDAEAEHPRVHSCSTSCSVCQAHGCFTCPGCSLHYDASDHGPTLLLQHKKVEAPADEKAYFVLGNRCIEMSGGFCALLDGASILHGAWRMKPLEDTCWRQLLEKRGRERVVAVAAAAAAVVAAVAAANFW
jgi:hypothetical protein